MYAYVLLPNESEFIRRRPALKLARDLLFLLPKEQCRNVKTMHHPNHQDEITSTSIPIDSILEPSFLMQSAQVLVSVAFICILSPIDIDIKFGNVVPISLQSLVVLLVPALVGKSRGCTSVFIYLVLGGFLNLPVFAKGSSGRDVLFGETSGGFLWAFLVGAFWSGSFLESSSSHRIKFKEWMYCFLIGHTIILTLGFLWIGIANSSLISSFSVFQKDMLLPLLPGLFCKSLIGAVLASIANQQLIQLNHTKKAL